MLDSTVNATANGLENHDRLRISRFVSSILACNTGEFGLLVYAEGAGCRRECPV